MRIAIDASAIMAIVFREEGFEVLTQKVVAADECWLSPVNYWEALTVARRYQGEQGEVQIQLWLLENAVLLAEINARQAELALEASRRFGGRPARLNMGDCFAYALAKEKSLPLLFKGNDFSVTDVEAA